LFFNQRLEELFTQLTDYTLGILITLAAAFAWALYGLAQKQLLTVWSSVSIMLVIYLACAVLMLPLVTPSQILELDALQRSEEHTSELQSRENLVCRLLLEKK